MKGLSRQVLEIDLSKRTSAYRAWAELGDLLGGLGVGLGLVQQFKEVDPAVFSIGPLNGFFPFVSKFSLLSWQADSLIESYVSGRFALMMRFSNVDGLVIHGLAARPVFVSIDAEGSVVFYDFEKEADHFYQGGPPGRRSFIVFNERESLADGHFLFEARVGRKLFLNNLRGLSLASGRTLEILKEKEYLFLYQEIMNRGRELEVSYSDKFSCGGCPAGCDYSAQTEERPELVFSHCLVSCGFAAKIYEDLPLVFSCLNSLGYAYRHEELELIPERIKYLKDSF